MEFHISRKARDKYHFDLSLYRFSGNVIFSDMLAVRKFTQKINAHKDLVNHPDEAVRAGEINALGLIDEILHLVLALYRQKKSPQVNEKAISDLQRVIGNSEVDSFLLQFLNDFPPLAVYRQEILPETYLEGNTEGISNRANTLEEILMLWLANQNPAFSPYRELYKDDDLITHPVYLQFISHMKAFFITQPEFGPFNQNIIDLLRSPAIAAPDSLQGQLEYIRLHWADLLGEHLLKLLTGLDMLKEEQKLHFMGPGEITIPVYRRTGSDEDIERYSMDMEWMPRLVLLAKNTHVWLDQLSKIYQEPITRLDQIPDEELNRLAEYGFSGLWLIGIWERSHASARIKQLCGNPDAIASAYSLMSYDIAADLGGDEAYENLRQRAWQKGIRLASDMVPNHMGIDSNWVLEHPDWFLWLDTCPFPSYTFSGENLSPREGTGIFIEDHYFDRSDAAVVFKHVDYSSGQTRYIYHGNDGTSMPWNDTAQLNYLNPEVREAVIQTIIQVAKKSPIIRFDAAMTLTKRHYQRLWFPEPGSGGDIPSRAEHGLNRAQFEHQMPDEFWREVVERIKQEAPDTLLLAEAFWLMESYFVRTLGMHRVYNSAFMNLLRDEENARYRMLMKNTLEFDPQILKRYVNFMNNPDERTAIDQFGKDDKYFGICTLMCTLPGLPMFGHGQIEGFSEKYGMEFRRSYWNEIPDEDLIIRHQREIFPLLHRRALFAEVDDFRLFDFIIDGDKINEDVFVYTNRLENQRTLIVYHNRFANTAGRVIQSVEICDKNSANKTTKTYSLQECLGISCESDKFLIFRDCANDMEYIRSCEELCNRGMFFILNAYQRHVFIDFREVTDHHGLYRGLCDQLNGAGVNNIDEALNEYHLRFIHEPFREIMNTGYLQYLLQVLQSDTRTDENHSGIIDEAGQKYLMLIEGIERHTHYVSPIKKNLLLTLREEIQFLLDFTPSMKSIQKNHFIQEELDDFRDTLKKDNWCRLAAILFLFTHRLDRISSNDSTPSASIVLNEWNLNKIILQALQKMQFSESEARSMISFLHILLTQQTWYDEQVDKTPAAIMQNWYLDSDIRNFLQINRFNQVTWFNREAMKDLIWWMKALSILEAITPSSKTATQIVEQIMTTDYLYKQIQNAVSNSDYQVEQLMKRLNTSEGE